MKNRTMGHLWIAEREKELKSLEGEITTCEEKKKIRGINIRIDNCEDVRIANCEEEIEFIEEFQKKNLGLYYGEIGAKKLVEMKGIMEWNKKNLEKAKKELEAKVIQRNFLEFYVKLAKDKYKYDKLHFVI